MYIYFVEDPREGFIKIGFASDPLARLSGLQISNPYPLKLLGVARAARADEHTLHEIFAEHRVQGEWFLPHEDITGLVSKLSTDVKNCPKIVALPNKYEYLRSCGFGQQEIANHFGVSRQFVHSKLRKKTLHQWEKQMRIYRGGKKINLGEWGAESERDSDIGTIEQHLERYSRIAAQRIQIVAE